VPGKVPGTAGRHCWLALLAGTAGLQREALPPRHRRRRLNAAAIAALVFAAGARGGVGGPGRPALGLAGAPTALLGVAPRALGETTVEARRAAADDDVGGLGAATGGPSGAARAAADV
jgi:hypothetical protein